ncbi:MAG: flagellar hook-basal body complex protein FliE [Pseudomonadota bacterium]
MVNPTAAAAAYSSAPQMAVPMEARDQADKSAFAELMAQTGQSAIDNLHQGEEASLEALVGTADINEVVLAVNQAELSLQTLVTLRDKVIEAYQEVARMPI